MKPAPTAIPAPTTESPPTRHGLAEIVRAFKTFSARRINEMRHTPGTSVWQRGFYDHVIRNDRELAAIRRYIADNPRRWAADKHHPDVDSRSDDEKGR